MRARALLGWLNPRRRLFAQVYLAFVGIVLLFLVLVAVTFGLLDDEFDDHAKLRGAVAIAERLLPAADAPPEVLRAALEHWRQELLVDLAVFGPGGARLAAAGHPIELPTLDDEDRDDPGFVRFRRGHIIAGGVLSDGRWLVMRNARDGAPKGPLGLVVLAIAIGIGAYPIARRISGRLERLRARVDAVGEGDLSVRVDVEGRDEVAHLARSFNRAVARIEELVEGQRAMLAGASHELRTPLARMRMALELLDDGGRPELRERIDQDIVELDTLIDEVLAASRFDSGIDRGEQETVDLLALASQEAARTGAVVTGSSCLVACEPRWMARLVRNLLENARRHGGENVVVTVIDDRTGGPQLLVEDDGPGIAAEHQEQIFEPFFRPPGMREGHDRGYGLGLALVRQIAQRHGGDARCVARPGGGTRFEIFLRAC